LPVKRQIVLLLLALATCAIGWFAYSQLEHGWRWEIDRIIEKELNAAGFQNFDGKSYSYPISDEAIGLVEIYNQELFKYPDPNRAIINTRLGMIHYQLNDLQTGIENKDYRHAILRWTLGASTIHGPPASIEYFEHYRFQPSNEKEAAINALVTKIKQEVVPLYRKKLSTIADVTDHLTGQNHPDEFRCCIALATSGKVTEARARANQVSDNIRGARINKSYWSKFRASFDKWITDGALVPKVNESRAKVMKAAEERKNER
jgi:hypothetical protein